MKYNLFLLNKKKSSLISFCLNRFEFFQHHVHKYLCLHHIQFISTIVNEKVNVYITVN